MAPEPIEPVESVYFRSYADFTASKRPGSFHIAHNFAEAVLEFHFFCPCGCGSETRLYVGRGRKPKINRVGWAMFGDTDALTIEPEVHHVGHWRGRLTDGVWHTLTS